MLPTLFLLGLVGGAWGHRAPEDWPAGLWRGRPAPCRLCGRWQHRQTLSHRLPPPHVWALATPPQPRFWPSRAWGLCPLPGLRTCGCPLTRLRALPTALEAGRRLPGPFCFTDRRCAPQGQREGARGTGERPPGPFVSVFRTAVSLGRGQRAWARYKVGPVRSPEQSSLSL